MTIKNILLHLGDDPRNQVRTQVALTLTAQHDAQVTALYTIPRFALPAYIAVYVPPEVIEQQRKIAREKSESEHEKFEEICRKQASKHEWRVTEDDPVAALSLHAHYADLVIVAQPDPNADLDPGIDALPHELVLSTGRPILIVPFAGKFTKIGGRVLLAWNGSREASRAAHDALPILRKAKKVLVFSVNPTKRDHIPGADIAAHLAQHGVKAEVSHTVARDIEVGDALLGAVSDLGADLVVMGAWGRSRMRELVLGGATKELLVQMTVPVLMSH